MKIIALILALASPALASNMSHDDVVSNIKRNKVGRAPQQGKDGPHPKYEKAEKVLPKAKRKKHSRKMSYKVAEAVATPTPVESSKPYYKTTAGIDMRSCDGPIENQQTPWCTAFSIKGILETMICDHTRLSAHHAWSFYKEYSVDAAAESVPGNNLTTWDMWPESKRKPINGYLNVAKSQLTGMKLIDEDDDIAEVLKALDSGVPVYVGMSVPADMASCYSVIRPKTKVTSGGHALEIVGYGSSKDVPGGVYLIIKQSWGTDCGDKGYQYMPVSVCDNNGMYCEFYKPTGAKKVK